MGVSKGDSRSRLGAVIGRTATAGLAIGAVSVAGGSLVLADVGSNLNQSAVLIATVLVALGVGAWAGTPQPAGARIPLRERWLSAAAVTAVGGSFATFWALYQQVYPGAWWGVAGLLLVVAVPVYALALLLPPLLTWADEFLLHDEEEWDPWHSFGPALGGCIGGAAGGVLLTAFLLLPNWSTGVVLMAAALLLLLPLVIKEPAGNAPTETLLFETVSAFGWLRVTEVSYPADRQPERRLYLNDEEESGELSRSGAPTLAYVAAAESWLNAVTRPGASYLFLGGGAYTLPRRIAERDARAKITVVELDPEITRIAYRYFGLSPHHSIVTVHGDGRAFLEQERMQRFDRIYVDVYSGREALPYPMITLDAASALERSLDPGGLVGLNVIGVVQGRESSQLWSIVRTFAEVFPTVAVYTHLGRDFPERQNVLLACAPDADRELPATAGHFELWPREEWPAPEGMVLFRDLHPQRGTAGSSSSGSKAPDGATASASASSGRSGRDPGRA